MQAVVSCSCWGTCAGKPVGEGREGAGEGGGVLILIELPAFLFKYVPEYGSI